MKIQQFLEYHGVARNPFAEEDAQSDPVFKEHCIFDTYHPAWDKIFGDPSEPSTSIVFGEKGAGKTAMRLQIARHLEEFSRRNPQHRAYVVHYDDFNPFLDRFVSRQPGRRRRIDKALAQLRLWDHMDAILAVATTTLIDQILSGGSGDPAGAITPEDLARLDRHQRRDFLLLSACYDQSTEQPYLDRWNRLRRQLRFWAWKADLPFWIGTVGSGLVVILAAYLFWASGESDRAGRLWEAIPAWGYPVAVVLLWLPWLIRWTVRFSRAISVTRGMRVLARSPRRLAKALLRFTSGELSGQPLPNKHRTDDRYELLVKLQSVLATLRFGSLFVLVDRVDEPHLINGAPELMRALIWPMLDNKFLKHPGVGIKLMLPAELKYFVDREDRTFAQRARLDKQNVVPSLAWTGEALFDVANARLRACAIEGRTPTISEFFDPSISHQRLLDAFRSLRVPRHLHKFLYRLLVAHCNAHTDDAPVWKISRDQFESELALYERDMADIG